MLQSYNMNHDAAIELKNKLIKVKYQIATIL